MRSKAVLTAVLVAMASDRARAIDAGAVLESALRQASLLGATPPPVAAPPVRESGPAEGGGGEALV